MAKRDYYEGRGVDRGADDGDIKKAYRRLAMKSHPDRNPADAAAEERFKSIQAAHETIGSADYRREHDQRRRMEEMFGGGGQGNPFGGGFGGVDLGDIFSQFMGGRGFGGGFPSSRRRRVKMAPNQEEQTLKPASISR